MNGKAAPQRAAFLRFGDVPLGGVASCANAPSACGVAGGARSNKTVDSQAGEMGRRALLSSRLRDGVMTSLSRDAHLDDSSWAVMPPGPGRMRGFGHRLRAN